MNADLPIILWISVKVAACATLLILVPALWLGFVLAKRRVPCRALVQMMVTLPMVLPPVAIGLILLRVLAPLSWPGTWISSVGPWLLTWKAAVLAAGVMAFPLLVRAAEAAFAAVPARSDAVAAGLGLSRTRTFWSVTLPLARPGLVGGILLAFARALGEFGATILVAGNIRGSTETLALGIYARVESGDASGAWWLVGISVLLTAGLVWIGERLRGRAAA